MAIFEHIRHKPPVHLAEPRPLKLVVCPVRSGVNLSRLVRLAGCSGVPQIIHAGNGKIDRQIAREAADCVQVVHKRSLQPVLRQLRQDGYHCVGLEQTTNSECLYDFQFQRQTALVIGSERDGLSSEILAELQAVVEIPVYGSPASYNIVTATTMAVYEYCRQFPAG